MFTVLATKGYMRKAKDFVREHPHMQVRVTQVVDDLMADPWQPHLRTHKLHGKLAGMYAVRLTESYRITMTIAVTEKEIVLLDIGTHDEVYR